MASKTRLASHVGRERVFKTIQSIASHPGPRLGKLSLPGREPIETPHYIAISSRGVVPHLSPDTFARQTHISGVYVALEDFIEKAPEQTPPLYKFARENEDSPLRRYIGLPDDSILVLGARRIPAIPCPTSGTPTSASILTSVGVKQLAVTKYSEVAEMLQPDILVALADVPYGAEKVSRKKLDKITERSARWMQEQVVTLTGDAEDRVPRARPVLFAPLLPLEIEVQKWYTNQLAEEMCNHIDGLAIYSDTSLQNLPAPFQDLPKMSFTEPGNPHKLLWEISQGVDIFAVPFIGAATDAGIALDFSFPPTPSAMSVEDPVPLGIDMWQASHAADASPLRTGCICYACSNHHRAYLQHLLMAKEMLGWVLLQIHNHHVMDDFFAGIRRSIDDGAFDEHRSAFSSAYEPELPMKTGQGPRVRGYQYKSDGPNEVKRNPSAYRPFDGAQNKLAETALPDPEANATDLEAQGFAQKQ